MIMYATISWHWILARLAQNAFHGYNLKGNDYLGRILDPIGNRIYYWTTCFQPRRSLMKRLINKQNWSTKICQNWAWDRCPCWFFFDINFLFFRIKWVIITTSFFSSFLFSSYSSPPLFNVLKCWSSFLGIDIRKF